MTTTPDAIQPGETQPDEAQPDGTPGMAYNDLAEMPWEVTAPGSRRKVLRLDDTTYVALIQWDPGFQIQYVDEHGGDELVYVLEGTFIDQYRSSGPGTIIRGAPGSSHSPGTPDGVTFMTVRSLSPAEAEVRLKTRGKV